MGSPVVAPSSGPPWGVLPGRNPSWSPADHLLHHNGNPTLSPRNRTSRFCEHHRPTNGNGQPVPSQPTVFPGFCCDLGQICCKPVDDVGSKVQKDKPFRRAPAGTPRFSQSAEVQKILRGELPFGLAPQTEIGDIKTASLGFVMVKTTTRRAVKTVFPATVAVVERRVPG